MHTTSQPDRRGPYRRATPLVDVLGAVEHLAQLGALDLRQRPRLGLGRPLGLGRRRALAVPAVPARLRLADRRARATHAHHCLKLGDGLVDHLVSPCGCSVTPSVASCSNSAESFPWTSITLRALSSSLARRWFCWRSRTTSRSRGSAGGRPDGVASACSAPRSRCLRHSETRDVYRPSRRSSEPLPALSSRSYSSRTRALYVAEYRRGPRARSGTSGSGSVVSPMAPAWACAFRESSVVVVTGELLPRPLSSMIQQPDLPHWRLTQRGVLARRLQAILRPALVDALLAAGL